MPDAIGNIAGLAFLALICAALVLHQHYSMHLIAAGLLCAVITLICWPLRSKRRR